MDTTSDVAARTVNLVKRFGPREVVSNVNLVIKRNQVHALLGANGSGKSTVAKMLAGYYQRDSGKIFIGDAEMPAATSVIETAALGVRVVHQDLGLVDGISVLENVAIGRKFITNSIGLINWSETRERAQTALQKVGLDSIDVDTPVAHLQTWQRVAIACARALYDGLDQVRLLILDEITAALPPGEVELVLGLVRRLKALGAGILYVSHRFEEVMEVTDVITVLRDGKTLAHVPINEVTPRRLIDWVSGDNVRIHDRETASRTIGRPILRISELCTERLHSIDMVVHAGEICGIIGRAGCGKSALGRALFGQEKVVSGSIMLDEKLLKVAHPIDAIGRGVAYVPQDRQRAGILPTASVRENFTIANLRKVSHLGLLSASRERVVASNLVKSHSVVPQNSEELIQNLSGGNQQKVVVGRWSLKDVQLFILDEPTEGVDAGARASIYEHIRGRATAGAAVLILSSSLEEIVDVCDRAMLLADGRLVCAIEGEGLTVSNMEHLLMHDAHTDSAPVQVRA